MLHEGGAFFALRWDMTNDRGNARRPADRRDETGKSPDKVVLPDRRAFIKAALLAAPAVLLLTTRTARAQESGGSGRTSQ